MLMYITLSSQHQFSTVMKNSEFLGFAAPAASLETAQTWLEAVRQRYPDSSHVCWAYKIGQLYRFSDDGEPSGTAGAPMYRALELSGLDCVVLAVVRYYGGTNLGAGGLARAYGGVAAEVLRIAEKLEVHPRIPIHMAVPFHQVGLLYRLLEDFDVTQQTEEFTSDGLEVKGLLLESQLEALKTQLQNVTRGRGELVMFGE